MSLIADRSRRFNKTLLLLIPAILVFIFLFAVPVGMLLAIAFNEKAKAIVTIQPNFTLEHFQRFFSKALYTTALQQSLILAFITTIVNVIMGYPVAYVIAKTRDPNRNTLLMILILIPFQVDMLIRSYGLVTILGDNGLINGSLIERGIISEPLPLMYNTFGVVIALTQFCIPFMVLSLIGIIKGINPSLMEAARNLGAGRWQAFFRVELPLSMPGILAGSLFVFAISISTFVGPVLLGGWKVVILPMLIFQQISDIGNWQFGATIAATLLIISLILVYSYHRATQLYLRGIGQ
jgi:putative spermidine/putrescine transport system permease protein